MFVKLRHIAVTIDMFTSREVECCIALRIFDNLVIRTLSDNLSSMNTSTRSDIDNIITCPHNIFIVFNHNHRISKICELMEIGYEKIIISRMKTYRWLIKDIDDTFKLRSDLSCESYSLSFTTRESLCSTVKCHIFESNTREKIKTFNNILEDLIYYLLHTRWCNICSEKIYKFSYGQCCHLTYMHRSDTHKKG